MALVASAAALATGSAAPVAHAEPNDAKPSRQTVSDETCKQWEDWASQDRGEALRAFFGGRLDLFYAEMQQAQHVENMASDAGCAWAARIAPVRGDAEAPRPTIGITFTP